MDKNESLYDQVVEITRDYLGPSSERFVKRQIQRYIHKSPEELSLEDIPKLAAASRQTIASLTEDDKMTNSFTSKLLTIGKKNTSKKNVRVITVDESSDYSDLRERIRWYVELRWFFLGALGLSSIFPSLATSGFSDVVRSNLIMLAVGFFINFVLSILVTRPRHSKFFYFAIAGFQILFDISLASLLLVLNGGVESRTVIVYAIPILMSGALLGTLAVYVAGVLSAIAYITLVLFDYFQLIKPENISNSFVHTSLDYVLHSITFYPVVLLVLTIITSLIVRVIRSREHLEIELKGISAEKARLNAIVQTMGSALVAIDRNGTINLVNDAFENLTGWHRSEVIGQNVEEILPMIDESGQQVKYEDRPMVKLLNRVASSEIPTLEHISQFQYARKNRTTFPFTGSLSPIVVRGRIIGATTVFDDVTELKQVQQLKSNFVALASHQLKTPIAEIKAYLENMLNGVTGTLTPKQTDYLQQMYKISDHSMKLVSDLLDISVIEQNKVGLNIKDVKLSSVIKRIETIYNDRIKQKGLRLSIIQKDPNLIVSADDSKLVEVIGNLLSNAINYTPSHGTITLETRQDARFGMIIVTDKGSGMDEAALNHIFQKEGTLQGAPVAEGGSGLGLYLSKQLVTLQGGSIGVLSTTSKGTSIYIKIPMRRYHDNRASKRSKKSSFSRG